MNYYNLSHEEVLSKLSSSREGLLQDDAKKRLEEGGPNELKEVNKRPAWVLFVNQFKNFMIMVLIAAAVISGITGDITDMVIILVIVFLNAVLGFVQEYRADKAMNALKKMAAPEARVVRGGKVSTIKSADLVIGDIVLLEAGNSVPADLRLIESHSLRIDESALTGESVAVDKDEDIIEIADPPLGDQLNMSFKGTVVTNGRAVAIVVSTGMNTEIGKIATLLQEGETTTPLQQRMEDFGKKISWIILGICVVLFGVGILRGEDIITMLMVSISLAVAAIPEALPALITISLARGARRLVKKNALIRKLPAVETLGSVTYICTDKTGTLTLNKMSVTNVLPEQNSEFLFNNHTTLDLAMACNHDVKIDDEKIAIGDPTELALVNYIIDEFGADEFKAINDNFPRKMEIPFDSDRKCMSTIHRFEGRFIVFTKGAVEVISKLINQVPENLKEDVGRLASQGLRVLAFGYKFIDTLPTRGDHHGIEDELTFAGMVTMIDPPREEAMAAVGVCRKAGINVVMITGDHRETAAAIASQIGILDEGLSVVNGTELKNMSQDELEEKVEGIRVYARVSPSQKLDIVKALQAKGHFVAMTGDGVNDAPSLKASNIGVAMGINGTDVSKQSAHMILLDDNFATIVKAVKEGRRIFDNIRKFVKYIMTCNSAEIWTIFLAPLFGLPIPLLPIHILWINLVTDGLPGLTLAGERAEPDVMRRPPRRPDEGLFAGGIGWHILWVGILMSAVTLGVQWYSIEHGNSHWQTMVFTVLSLSQLGHVMAIRSDNQFLYKQGLFSNSSLTGAVLLTFLLQLMVIYLPIGNELFKTQPLSIEELLICIGLSTVVFHAVEIEKYIRLKMQERKSKAKH